jgi:hypothetical protein
MRNLEVLCGTIFKKVKKMYEALYIRNVSKNRPTAQNLCLSVDMLAKVNVKYFLKLECTSICFKCYKLRAYRLYEILRLHLVNLNYSGYVFESLKLQAKYTYCT